MLKHARRATIALTTSTVLTLGLATGPAAQAATPEAESASQWLAGELQGGLLYQEFGGVQYAEYGGTLDAFFAFLEVGTQPGARQEILDALEAHVTHQTPDYNYIGNRGDTYAGAAAKLLTALQTAGVKPSEFADGDLRPRLKSVVVSERGARFGRVVDDAATDYANTLSQSWAVRAFAGWGEGHKFTARTATFLLKQQCDAGYFRESMKGRSCEAGIAKDNSAPSVDATALAVEALRDAKKAGVAGLGDDIRQALRWLVKVQNKNGSFTGNDVPNANSTGLASSALAGTKWSDEAADAANWLRKLQVTEANSEGALVGEEGAVAYNRAGFVKGEEDGIEGPDAITWALATAQSIVALDS